MTIKKHLKDPKIVTMVPADVRRAKAIEENRTRLGDPPEHFDKERSKIWRDLGQLAAQSVQLHSVDSLMFAMLCSTYDCYLRIDDEMREAGFCYSTSSNHMDEMVRQHPLFAMRRDTEKTVLRYAEEFGLTPKSREKLKHLEFSEPDPADEFFS